MTFPTADGQLTTVRGSEVPMAKRAQTDLQRRLDSEQQMHHEGQMQRRDKGGPDGLGEVDRELTMATGALEGLYQRVGALAAVLGPVMPGGAVQKLMEGPGRVENHDFEITSEVGQRVRAIHRAISECEDTLGYLVVNVRL